MNLLIACLLALIAQTPAPQTPAEQTSAVSGIAVDGSTGRPLAGALIYLLGERGSVRVHARQVTDAKGRFVFANQMVVDQFTLSGTKSGYLEGFNAPESAAPGTSMPVRVAAGEWYPSARVALYPPGAIGGRVSDESGAPVVGVDVRLLSRVKIQGRSEFAAGPLSRTDDRGEFRFAGLPPGQYVTVVPSVQTTVPSSLILEKVRGAVDPVTLDTSGGRLMIDRYVTPPPPVGGKLLAYPVTFYPGTSSAAEAGVIKLGYSESRNDLEIRLTPVPTFRVSGIVSGPPDAFASLTLRLLPAGLENLGYGSEAATALVDADGRFTFLGVPEGSYLVDGPRSATELNMAGTMTFEGPRLPPPPGYNGSSLNSENVPALPGIEVSTRTHRSSDTPNFWVRSPLVVSSDLENVTLPLRPMGLLSGSVRFEADPTKKDQPPRFYVLGLDPATANPGLGLPRAPANREGGGEFSIAGLAPAPYFLRFETSAGWLIKSITAAGRDYTFSPFDAASSPVISGVDIVITNATPTLAGIVTAPDGAINPGGRVLVFPADRNRWFNYGLKPSQFTTLVAGTNGSYRTVSLPAGDYFAVSVAGPVEDWMRPEFLEIAARSATRVTLAWGQTSTVDLRIVEIRR